MAGPEPDETSAVEQFRALPPLPSGRRHRRLTRLFVWAAGGFLLVLVVLAGLAWYGGVFGNRLSPAERAELDGVYRRLAVGYKTERVFVQWKSTTRVSVRHGVTRSDPHLAISMTDPPFLRTTSLDKAEPHAREIAYVARSGLTDPARARVVEVQLVEQVAGTSARRHRRFFFRADQIGGTR